MAKRYRKPKPGHYPDSLSLDAIDVMLREVIADLRSPSVPEPTTALLDGSALQRRHRREARRAIGAVVRALPSARSMVVDVEEAA